MIDLLWREEHLYIMLIWNILKNVKRKHLNVLKTNKLILDLHNNKNYVVQERTLGYYKSLSMQVEKTHQILVFKEEI